MTADLDTQAIDPTNELIAPTEDLKSDQKHDPQDSGNPTLGDDATDAAAEMAADDLEAANEGLRHLDPTWIDVSNQTVVIIDTETTGLDHKTEQLIEVAAVRMTNGEVVDRYSALVKPTVPIRHSSFQIHHISEEMLENERSIEEVLPELLEFIGEGPIVAHSVIFDYTFINYAHKKVFGKRWKVPRVDSLEIFKSVFPEEPSHGLSALLARFGFESFVSHRALDDADNLAKVFPRLMSLYHQKHQWQVSQFGSIPYLMERYNRLQKAIQTLQSEVGDLRDVFKLYFQNGGTPVRATTGELLVSQDRRYYEYQDAKVWQILKNADLVERAAKLNPRALDKLLGSETVDEAVREGLKDARTQMHSARAVQVIKPEDK
jgi:DNA polymerase III epsilon subunit family exonuclease